MRKMFSQSTVTDLINLYYNVCDKWFNYLPKNCTPTQVAEYRTNIVNTIYLIVYNRMPKGNDTFVVTNIQRTQFKRL